MRRFVPLAVLLLAATVAAQPYLHDFTLVPAEPQDGDHVSLSVRGALPDACWELVSVVGSHAYLNDLASPDIGCPTVIIDFEFTIDLGVLATGYHTVVVRETHVSERNPGTWSHPIDFVVGDPPIPAPTSSWGRIKALFR